MTTLIDGPVEAALRVSAIRALRWTEEHVRDALLDCLRFWPELADHPPSVRVGRLRSATATYGYNGDGGHIALSDQAVIAGPTELRGVLSHELAHAAQHRGLYPSGERAADLAWLSRCGSEYPREPSYLKLTKSVAHEWVRWALRGELLALEAWHRRGKGERQYIRWWEEAMRTPTRTIQTTFPLKRRATKRDQT